MTTSFAKDFHLLPTELGPVVFHAGSYRLFQVDEAKAATLEALEAGRPVAADAVEDLRAALKLALGDQDGFQLKSSILGNNEDLSVFYFFVSQDCNLGCLYCYGDGGDYGKGRMLMADVTAQAFLDRFVTTPGKRYMINLFGGEPLMNMPMLKRFIAEVEQRARQLGSHIDVNVTTNGTLWNDDIRDFLRDHVTNVTVSLDGPPEIHDAQRPARGSFSPYERAMRTLEGLREIKPANTVIRTIVTHDSCRQVGDIYRHNAKLAPGGVGLTMVDVDPANPLALTDQDHQDMLDQMVETNRASLLSFAQDDDPQFFEYTFDLFEMVFFRRYRQNPCNAGRAVAAVAADGDIYPCHRFVGKDGFRMGNVTQDPPLDENHARIAATFREAGVDANPQCSQCWARYLCGGCCYVIALLRTGDIASPPAYYCRLKRTIYHELLATFATIMADEDKAKRLIGNVTRLLAGRAGVTC
ncbi:MAG TPA: SPASM domain-containing protein [Magnetospirillum sp.]|nr:SPASM domain-containing protein [Magnetospirillum sp.]